MIFKNREEAGKKLAKAIKAWLNSHQVKNNQVVILSLIRGGWPLGEVISQELAAPHLPIVAAKIGAPFNEEVAMGALCFNQTYFNQVVIDQLKNYFPTQELKTIIHQQVIKAKNKISSYKEKYHLDEIKTKLAVKNKLAIVVDDGVATGATAKAVGLFLKQADASQVVLATPVAPADFACEDIFDACIILLKDPNFQAVGQYYQDFSEVEI